MRQQGRCERKLFGLASRLAGKADETEDTDTGLHDHHVAGPGIAMSADQGVCLGPFALDHQGECVDVGGFPLGHAIGQRPCAASGL